MGQRTNVADTASSHEGKHRKWTANNINSCGALDKQSLGQNNKGRFTIVLWTIRYAHCAYAQLALGSQLSKTGMKVNAGCQFLLLKALLCFLTHLQLAQILHLKLLVQHIKRPYTEKLSLLLFDMQQLFSHLELLVDLAHIPQTPSKDEHRFCFWSNSWSPGLSASWDTKPTFQSIWETGLFHGRIVL